MKLIFTNLIYKLIELDNQIVNHNCTIDVLRTSYLEKEKNYLADENKMMVDTMKTLGLSCCIGFSNFDSYQESKSKFFSQMIETDSLLKQVKVLIKVFLDYDFIIENLDISNRLPFSLERILNQVSIYPKRLTLLYNRELIDESLYNSLFNENWLNQSVQGCSGLFVSLIKQYDLYSKTLIENKKHMSVGIISESLYRSEMLPVTRKLSKMMEYLFCPKIDKEYNLEQIIEQYGYLTDESIVSKCDQLNNILV